MANTQKMSAREAARLFLGAQGLLESPSRRVSPESLLSLVRSLGFLQIDTIQVVARAHDLTLHARRDGYRPPHLEALRQRRQLFEGWTHDASLIPAEWYPLWKARFRTDDARIRAHNWWRSLLGESSSEICRAVMVRIREEGPLKSADFAHPEKRGPWWGWKPQKAALDYLWRTGQLAVVCRDGFQKVYDLPGRVLPKVHELPEPEEKTSLDWFCAGAAERLDVFTPRELAGFWCAVDLASARRWCEGAAKEGRIEPVEVASADGSPPQSAFALPGWRSRARREGPERIRLLSPFDPIVRDRARAVRRFAFDYRLEAFTPKARRQHGYYVLPILDREELVGRLDAKLHRDRGTLEVRGLFWEARIRCGVGRRRRLVEALERLAAFSGAKSIEGLPARM
ncbi:MAG: YcaQ family DNA glycosylase [Acidobacteria bacterium]|nr:YcaQ family DNA glycosylase [Acidobacteriota bacterium]MCG3194515.1 hypothetical protein [Thermoanaerobaculia bacterium]